MKSPCCVHYYKIIEHTKYVLYLVHSAFAYVTLSTYEGLLETNASMATGKTFPEVDSYLI